MTNALGMAGDVSSAGAALAGLLLVFMGSISTSFDSYTKQEQRSVLAKFKWRTWFAFAGFCCAIFATFLAIVAKYLQSDPPAGWAIAFLIMSFVGVIAAALRSALDVK